MAVIPPSERFWRLVDVGDPDNCWEWQGHVGESNADYGYFRHSTTADGPKIVAHRFAYEDQVGPIPEGHQLDHLCRNTICVNPSHLEPVTHAENRRRARLTECRNGHDLTDPANCRWDANGNRRGCKVCWLARARERYNQRKSN